jgi:carboxyl-terminal processing protease
MYTFYIQNRNYFNGFSNVNDLVKGFIPSETEWNSFVKFAQKDGIQLNINQNSKQKLLSQMQYLMAKQVFRNEGYFEAVNIKDSALVRALDLIK